MDKRPFDPTTDKPRGLKRKERKQLNKAGFKPTGMDQAQAAAFMDDMTDYILDNFYPDIDFDDADNGDCVKFAANTIALTYGRDSDVKNSSKPGNGQPAEKQITA